MWKPSDLTALDPVMISDLQLRRNVLDELEFEPAVDAAHISVYANCGVVALTGSVASYAEKAAAERAARRVKGVTAIAQEIEIRLPSHAKRADDEIAACAVEILKWQAGGPADPHRYQSRKGDCDPDRRGRLAVSESRSRLHCS